jgi:GH15 family glucan-1,4-alpha-glucosidase
VSAPPAQPSRPAAARGASGRDVPADPSPYTPISDYGIIGDLHTAALVSLTGAVDWYCPRAFDGPSVFAAVLDAGRGGSCRIEPLGPFTTEQRYLGQTAVLVTTFRTATGVLELTDFMPAGTGGGRRFAEIHRRVVCLSGEVEFRVEFAPRFDYATGQTVLYPRRHGVLATDEEDEVLTLTSPPEIWWAVEGNLASATLKLRATGGAAARTGGDDGESPAAGPPGRPPEVHAIGSASGSTDGAGRHRRSGGKRGSGPRRRVNAAVAMVTGAVARVANVVSRMGGLADRNGGTGDETGDHGSARGGDDCVWFVLRYDDDEVRPLVAYESDKRLTDTLAFWKTWVSAIRYDGPYHDAVIRSAVTLKLLCYEPTGAIVAAPTTSLPEEIGGVRNWDYRFTWIRDSAFVLYSLSILGHSDEADRFMEFLKRVARRTSDTHLQVMYGIDGRRHLTEQTLPQLEGYRGSAPVRVGNAAYDQLQLDVYGELLETAYLWSRTRPLTEGTWSTFARLVGFVADNWRRPDSGIWEVRAGLRHYVHSKVMCWVALDRGIRMSREFALPAPLDRWEAERAAVHADVLANGWSEEKQSFVQYYGTDALDASNLVIPMVGFLPHSDPRVAGTVRATLRELTSEGEELVYRYRNEDGIQGGEGVFSICTFWLAEALALSGDHDYAEKLFERMIGHANHLGLYSEELDPVTGGFLGNFPQAFTHIALINCAHVMDVLRSAERTASSERDV